MLEDPHRTDILQLDAGAAWLLLGMAGNGAGAPTPPHWFTRHPRLATGTEVDVPVAFDAGRVVGEGEVAIVIGAPAHRVTPEQARRSIRGYTIANDLTFVDQARPPGFMHDAKALPTPIAPVVVTDLPPDGFEIEVRVNGEHRASGSTGDLLMMGPELVSWLSQRVALQDRDVILTGSPGTGFLVEPGDVVVVEVEGIGTLTNRIVRAGVGDHDS